MRFLIDQNQSPLLVELIAVHGHDVAHARDRGRSGAPDRHVLEVAIDRSSIVGVSSVIESCPLDLQQEDESCVRSVFRRIALVGLGEHGSAEGDRRKIGWVDEPVDVADIIPLHVCDDGLGERARDAVSAMVVSNGDDHQVALGG